MGRFTEHHTEKYRLTEETKQTVDGTTLHRIQALMDFGAVQNGDLGGWIENEECLSKRGCCWAFGDSEIYGGSMLYENAVLEDHAVLRDNSRMHGSVRAKDSAIIEHGCDIFGEGGDICGATRIKNGVTIGGCNMIADSCIMNGAVVSDFATIRSSTVDGACISHTATLEGGVYAKGADVSISGNAHIINAGVYDHSTVDGNASVGCRARAHGHMDRIHIHGNSHITGNACVQVSVYSETIGEEQQELFEEELAG